MEHQLTSITENVLITHFQSMGQTKKSSTIWTNYSILRAMLSIKRNIDISKFTQDHLVLPGPVACPTCKKDCYLHGKISDFVLDASVWDLIWTSQPCVDSCWLKVRHPKNLSWKSCKFRPGPSSTGAVSVERRSTTVEIGKKKYNRGRRIEDQCIFGGNERDWATSSSFQFRIEPRIPCLSLREHIRPGTTIISDCWRSCQCSGAEGFRHVTVNHSLTFVDPDTGAHTQNIERLWRDVRGGIPRYGRREAHMSGYLAEFLFKRAVSRTRLIHEFMRAAPTSIHHLPLCLSEKIPRNQWEDRTVGRDFILSSSLPFSVFTCHIVVNPFYQSLFYRNSYILPGVDTSSWSLKDGCSVDKGNPFP
ncbi:uncharacterized protein LOC116166307 [Photinus pyralis]|uniref:uncharacterized protein LOC116166307 n=1 Tax=Photinus pyralis TaxID=7054 RepID=UPI0012676381|nr:uncharacterized protein LOC116166307 [Photinus pyralis]